MNERNKTQVDRIKIPETILDWDRLVILSKLLESGGFVQDEVSQDEFNILVKVNAISKGEPEKRARALDRHCWMMTTYSGAFTWAETLVELNKKPETRVRYILFGRKRHLLLNLFDLRKVECHPDSFVAREREDMIKERNERFQSFGPDEDGKFEIYYVPEKEGE